MDLNKKLIDQLSDLSRNIKSLTGEVKDNKNAISSEVSQKEETAKGDKEKKESSEEQNKNFLKSLEGIFQKGIGEISKSNLESNGLIKGALGAVKGKGIESALGAISPLKDKALEAITSKVKVPKAVSGLLGKIPKFATGGIMDEDGLALVGEKGPEVVKLDKGSEVISNAKSTELLKKETAPGKTVDQTLSEQKGPTEKQVEKYKKYLLYLYGDHYKEYPEFLDEDIKDWADSMRYHRPEIIDSLLEGKEDTFTKEDVAKLSAPVNKVPEVKQEPEEISKRDQRKKEREDKKKKKEEDLLKSKSAEEKGREKGEGNKLLGKGKDMLLSQGKNLISGKNPLGSILNPSSLLEDKSQLMSKGIGAATSLLSNKDLKGKALEKLKGIKGGKEEKSSMSIESPELKKTPPPQELKKEEAPKIEEKKIETPKAEIKESASAGGKETPKESKSATTENQSQASSSGETSKSEDFSSMISLLSRIASLLEGPLSFETMESPFRPDSRRF